MGLKIYLQHIFEKFSQGKNWQIKAMLLLTVLSLFFAFPSYSSLNVSDWQELFAKAASPFTNSMAGYGSHDAKITFRLVMPLLVAVLHLNIVGVLLLTGLIGILNFYLVLHLSYKITNDRVIAVIAGLCCCFIYFGKCSFIELRGGMFDGVAMCFLLLSLITNNNTLRTLLVFLSAWTDERGLIASSLIWVYIVYQHRDESFGKKILNVGTIGLYIAWLAYAVIRYILTHQYGLKTDTGGTGPSVLLNQINNIPIGVWSGLEGLWLLPLYAFVLLYRSKKYFELLMFTGSCVLIIIVGVSVLDITRSEMYALPSVFISLMIMRDYSNRQTLERILFYALALCFAYPAYYTGGKSSIWWTYPLPLQLLRFI
ncbi:MAG: hypothetical protein JST70_07075 [Bacteroidetes bacterium]|nr:hypothetical protein [Bacteroidota bacterium]